MFDPQAIGRWYHVFKNLSFSSNEFYEKLYEEVSRRQIPDLQLFRTTYAEKGLLSARREYYVMQRARHRFVVCAAPFGIDFFVSWWLLESPGCATGCLLIFLPKLGQIAASRTTFYEEDTATMFQEICHEAVMATIESMFSGMDTVPDFDREAKSRTRTL